MSPEGKRIRLYGGLTTICRQLASNIEEHCVVQYIRSNLLNMKLFSATLPKYFEVEVPTLRVDASKGRLNPADMMRAISDRFQRVCGLRMAAFCVNEDGDFDFYSEVLVMDELEVKDTGPFNA